MKKIIEAKEISMTKLSVELFLVSNLLVGFLRCFLYNKYILWLYFTSLLVMIVCKKVTKNVLKFSILKIELLFMFLSRRTSRERDAQF